MFDNIDSPEVDIICKYITSTDKALLIEADGEQVWIPISQINDLSVELSELERGDPLTITIPEWLAEDKELI